MDKLNTLDKLLEEQSDKIQSDFLKNISAKGKMTKNLQLDVLEDEGIALIEETIPYIENIYRNANRLIVNEEEIVKIELAKKITVDSVKHLSKHTNFIQRVDENGDVEPSRILNIEKEESYDTYENKLIYSLIKNIKLFMTDKKEALDRITMKVETMQDKKMDYVATTNIDGKEVTVSTNVTSSLKLDSIKNKIKQEKIKIDEIDSKLDMLTSLEIYKLYEKKKTKPITTQVKKTNLILKNTNFQYAIKLWDYLRENLKVDKEEQETVIDFEKETILKQLMNEIFLLQYLAMEYKGNADELIQKTKEDLVSNVLDYVELSGVQIEKIIIEKTKKGKLRDTDVERHVRKVFEQYINKYTKMVENIKVKK